MNKLTITGIVCALAYVPILLAFGPQGAAEITYTMTGTISIGVLLAYWPAIKIAARLKNTDLGFEDYLVFGIAFMWLAVFFRMIIIEWQVHFMSYELLFDNTFTAFVQFLPVVSGVLTLSAVRVYRDAIPTASTRRVMVSTLSGFLLGALSLIY